MDNMLSFKKCIILIFILCFTVRIGAVTQKDGLHIDEPGTFLCSTPCNLSPERKIFKQSHKDFDLKCGKNYTASEIKKALFESSSSPKDIIKDLKMLRNSNIDRPHTNLYFSLCRIFTAGCSGLDWHEFYMRGFILNLLIFILEFFFMFKLLALISKNEKFIACGLLISLFSLGSISNTILVRPYSLMECFYVGATYVFLSLLISDNRLKIKTLLLYSLISAIFLLSGYLSLVYAGLIFCILTAYSLFKKKYCIILNTFLIMVLSICIVLIIYPSFFDFSYKNEQYLQIMQNIEIYHSRFISSAEIVIQFLSKYLFYKLFIICIILFYIFEKIYEKFRPLSKQSDLNDNTKKVSLDSNYWIFLVIVSAIWAFLAMNLSWHREERYIVPAMPILSFLLVFFILKIKSTVLRYFLIILYIAIPLYNIYLEITENHSDINYLHSDVLYEFDEKKIYVLHMGETFWFYPNYYVVMPNNTIVRLEEKIPSKKFDIKSYILISDVPFPPLSEKVRTDFCFHFYPVTNYILKIPEQ